MDVVDRFQRALTYWEDTDEAGPARMPTRLTKACVQVLPVTGAGLSLFSAPTMRIPIGASDDTPQPPNAPSSPSPKDPASMRTKPAARWWPPKPSSPSGGHCSTI